MSTSSFTQRKQAEALLRSCPKRAHVAALLASLVGVFFLLRFCATAYAGNLAFGKAVLYGCLVLGLLVMNGLSLVGTSRPGYVILALASLVPMLDLLAQSLHLVTLLIAGGWDSDTIGVLACVLSMLNCLSLAPFSSFCCRGTFLRTCGTGLGGAL